MIPGSEGALREEVCDEAQHRESKLEAVPWAAGEGEEHRGQPEGELDMQALELLKLFRPRPSKA